MPENVLYQALNYWQGKRKRISGGSVKEVEHRIRDRLSNPVGEVMQDELNVETTTYLVTVYR
jgi:hypothetical protein